MYRDAVTLAKTFFYISLLKYRPQDVPASRELLALSVGIYFLLGFLLAKLDPNIANALPAAMADTAFLLVFTRLLLLLHRKSGRWTQTVTAMAGIGILFGLLFMPGVITLSESGPMTLIKQILSILLYLVLIWYVVVLAHIFRHAMSSSFALGIFISMIYMLLGVFIELTIVYPGS